MNVRTFLASALLCVLMTHVVDARPRNHLVEINNMIGCSNRFMWPCRGGVIPAHVLTRRSTGSPCDAGISHA
jgi:hypothetical protein